MKTELFDYYLPEELIAQEPVWPRDSSRLLVYDVSADEIRHRHFYQIEDELESGDVLVINNTKVIPARLYGKKVPTGGKIELLLLKRLNYTDWEVILKPGRIAKEGAEFLFGDGLGARIIKVCDDGGRIVRFFSTACLRKSFHAREKCRFRLILRRSCRTKAVTTRFTPRRRVPPLRPLRDCILPTRCLTGLKTKEWKSSRFCCMWAWALFVPSRRKIFRGTKCTANFIR